MIRKIGHYSLENPCSIYDEEALTALQLAARTAGKMNEVIEGFNDLDGETHAKMDEQDARLSAMEDTQIPEGLAAVNHTNSALVFCNEMPRVTKTGGNVTVTLPGLSCIYHGQSEFTGTNLAATAADTNSLFSLLFNPGENTLSMQPAYAKVPANLVRIGLVYGDNVILNNNGFAQTSAPVTPFKAAIALVWTPEVPVVAETDSVAVATVKDLTVYNGKTRHVLNGTTQLVFDQANVNIYNILYDVQTNAVKVQPHDATIPAACMIIGQYHKLVGLSLNMTNPQQFGVRALCSLILGAGAKTVSFDNVNKTVTFPSDTLIMVNMSSPYNGTYRCSYSIKAPNNVVSYADKVSSALGVFFNRSTEKLVVLEYHELPAANLIPVATFRTTNGAVSINAPWDWNGKSYNMTAESFGGSAAGYADASIVGIAHRGLSAEAPENTLAAFRAAVKKGFKHIEVDVQKTADGIFVLLHDDTVDRTSNGSGNVSEMTYAQLNALDFGAWFGAEFAGEKIVTLDEFIVFCKCAGVRPWVELKNTAYSNAVEIARYLQKHCKETKAAMIVPEDIAENCQGYSSVEVWVLAYTMPELDNIVLTNTEARGFFLNAENYDPDYDIVGAQPITNKTIPPIVLWTVDDPAQIRELCKPKTASGIATSILDSKWYFSGVVSNSTLVGDAIVEV